MAHLARARDATNGPKEPLKLEQGQKKAKLAVDGHISLVSLVVLDIFSRMVVGWAMDAHRDEALVEQAARMALARRQPDPGLLHHSDRGGQYTAADYCELLASYGIVVSMSGKGNCYDSALMESFFGTPKSECVDRQSFQSRAQARQVIFEYLEAFYNRQRLHSSLGYLSPVTYEQQAN